MNITPAPMIPLQFASSPSLGDTLKAAGTSAAPMARALGQPPQVTPQAPGSAIPGAAGPTSVGGPAGPTPLQAPSLLDALKNMSPAQVMAALQRTATPQAPTGAPASPPQGGGLPGAALFQQAGMADPSTFGG